MAHAKPSNYSAIHNVGFNINGQKLFEPTNQSPDICHANYTYSVYRSLIYMSLKISEVMQTSNELSSQNQLLCDK